MVQPKYYTKWVLLFISVKFYSYSFPWVDFTTTSSLSTQNLGVLRCHSHSWHIHPNSTSHLMKNEWVVDLNIYLLEIVIKCI